MRRPLPPDRIEGLLEPARGLVREEAAARLARFGPNQVVEAPPHPWRELLRETAKDPMPWFLAGTGALYAALGERAEALTLLVSILPLVGMDAYLHRRTRAATEGLRRRLATNARVLRDGILQEIASEQIVPGDLVSMGPGETFPADGLLLAGDEMQADESALTGEAFPVRKRPLPAGPPGASIDAQHWGFAGTRLLTGSASLRVVVTGGETWYGEILRSAAQTTRARTPLQISIAGLTRTLLVAALVLCVVLAGVRLRQGFGWLDALLSAATLAVAALPEEFPVVFALFLGVGVHRLAQRRALVRRAVCVENIGRVTCVCSDKTGTLTLGELRLTHLLPAREGADADLLRAGALASRAESGDPLDAAILAAAKEPRRRRAGRDLPLHRGPPARDRRAARARRRTAGRDQGLARGRARARGAHGERARGVDAARARARRRRPQGDRLRFAQSRRRVGRRRARPRLPLRRPARVRRSGSRGRRGRARALPRGGDPGDHGDGGSPGHRAGGRARARPRRRAASRRRGRGDRRARRGRRRRPRSPASTWWRAPSPPRSSRWCARCRRPAASSPSPATA